MFLDYMEREYMERKQQCPALDLRGIVSDLCGVLGIIDVIMS